MEADLSRYRMIFDYHTHTSFSHGFLKPHGRGSIEENVQAAIKAGLSAIAISDHGLGHMFYGMKREDIPVIRQEIQRLREKYPLIKIYQSIEANIVSNGGNCLDMSEDEAGEFDFLLAGYHFGTRHSQMVGNWRQQHHMVLPQERKKLLCQNTEMTLAAIEENDLRILTHPGDKGLFDIAAIAKACAQHDTWMEISTWHAHLTVEEIKIAMKEDVSFVISSDAHTPDRVGSFLGGLERAAAAGLDFSRIVNIEKC